MRPFPKLTAALAALAGACRAKPTTTRTSIPAASSMSASKHQYLSHASSAAAVLNENWWDESVGLWDKGWWFSPNVIGSHTELVKQDPSRLEETKKYLEAAFTNARNHKISGGSKGNFLNPYYDDEGWWTMAWIQAYDATRNVSYLQEAESIFEDINASPRSCAGIHWTKKLPGGVALVSNALYWNAAAALATRVPAKKTYYTGIALSEAKWFYDSAFMTTTGNGTVFGGLDQQTCKPVNYVWTYTNGTAISALVESYKMTRNRTYLGTAMTITRGMIQHNTADGILHEFAYPRNPPMPPDEITENLAMFKGILMRGIASLQRLVSDDWFKTFLQQNADSVWKNNRAANGTHGSNWEGPVMNVGLPAHASALECLVAAAVVS